MVCIIYFALGVFILVAALVLRSFSFGQQRYRVLCLALVGLASVGVIDSQKPLRPENTHYFQRQKMYVTPKQLQL